MSARVLIVDDLFPNIKLLETKLTVEYFDVVSAMNGPDALAVCEKGLCDIVLLDVMMPGMDGFEVCRRIKSTPTTAHLPVVMVTALDQPGDRLRGLDAGADDFLTKPIDDTALMARVRSLVRLKAVTDELRSRAMASRVGDPLAAATAETGHNANVLIVEDRRSSAERLAAALGQYHCVEAVASPQEALERVKAGDYDVVLVSLDLQEHDGLRLCSQLRSLDRTRTVPVVMLADPHDRARIMRGLDLGVHDYLVRPIDRNELVARVRTQVKRRRFSHSLRESVQASMDLAVTDGLTGLHNRRYLDSYLAGLFSEPSLRDRPVALLILDIDRFKSINDRFGHDAGDEVLKEFATRIRGQTRGIDVVARYGGEEIVVVVPDTGLDAARQVAERIRERIEAAAFQVQRGTCAIDVTVSIGVAVRQAADDDPGQILKRADLALYQAKQDGRNRVVAAAA
ncbi:PleD family two-component system response regulator [Methylobacterium platani]|uniref:diguanylate cyclase n=2 Tax=Methylobacterium platani TaxID=427683 RepID=A0A179S931_9HYPH|nr:PleD family two-component system response regulator [Methylobacterium platani]KMO21523.1 response regulator PleD [Methylobacterium platani JCM 14648]OAS24261.1 PleD family two-component system response regulator [Methylobacterium platani]